MPSGDGAQHGWKEQYRPDGGFDLHHGTGQPYLVEISFSKYPAWEKGWGFSLFSTVYT